MPRPPMIGLLLAVAACAGPRAQGSPMTREAAPAGRAPNGPATWVLTPDGYGPVRVGSTVAQLNAELRDTMRADYELGGECAYVHPAVLPAPVEVMVHLDTVVRVDVDTAGVLTPEGAGLGDTEAKLLALYGARAVVTPHAYEWPAGHYVTVAAVGDSTRATVFETDGRVVTRLRAGRRPEVGYVEGCS